MVTFAGMGSEDPMGSEDGVSGVGAGDKAGNGDDDDDEFALGVCLGFQLIQYSHKVLGESPFDINTDRSKDVGLSFIFVCRELPRV